MITLVAYYEKSKPLIFFFQTKLTKNIHILVENNKKVTFCTSQNILRFKIRPDPVGRGGNANIYSLQTVAAQENPIYIMHFTFSCI